jgi:putative transposase
MIFQPSEHLFCKIGPGDATAYVSAFLWCSTPLGGRLNHNPHLHILASAGGLDTEQLRWVESIKFNDEEIMTLWRFAVTSYLEKAHRSGLMNGSSFPRELRNVIRNQTRRAWNIHVTPTMSKQHFLGYAGRYIRRPPISQRRILKVSATEVVYEFKDTRARMRRETHATPVEFMALIAERVPDRYRHSMRYFGQLSPRAKRDSSDAVFRLLGQCKRSRPPRISWRSSLIRNFQTDPILDSKGEPMQ